MMKDFWRIGGTGAFMVVFLALVIDARAGEIRAAPGEGTISAAAQQAAQGDVIRLEAGEYRDTVRLPAGVTLEGAGVDKTIFTASAYAAVTTEGERIALKGIEFRPGPDSVRAINSMHAVWVERCRFKDFKEAVNLHAAPLSDVVHCTFISCDIGVRALGKASPTVWGCSFRGGRIGVFCMKGGPYILNNVFRGQETGVLLVSNERSITRNNVFVDCGAAGIELKFLGAVEHSIRNNVFDSCKAAVVGLTEGLSNVSNCLVHGVTEPAFRDGDGNAAPSRTVKGIIKADPGLNFSDEGGVQVENTGVFYDKGIRLCSEPEGTPGYIGLMPECQLPGTNAKGNAPSPPRRFDGPVYIANCVAEEHVWLRHCGMTWSKQSCLSENGRRIDRLQVHHAGQPGTIDFDISRFYGELSLEP